MRGLEQEELRYLMLYLQACVVPQVRRLVVDGDHRDADGDGEAAAI